MDAHLGRRTFAEFLGTMLLVAVVVGSGIAAQRYSPNDAGLQLFENAAVTAAGLIAIILAIGPVSGAHLNPAVTLVDRFFGGVSTRDAGAYVAAQIAGACAGSMLANLMFGLSVVTWSTKSRTGGGDWLAEVVATAGLMLVVFAIVRSGRTSIVPFAVGSYIGAAYWFTSSTSFANPAVTIGRMFSDTFAGIAPRSVLAFVVFQLVGAAVGGVIVWVLYPSVAGTARDVVLPHSGAGGEAADDGDEPARPAVATLPGGRHP